jgi:hypothetical protein
MPIKTGGEMVVREPLAVRSIQCTDKLWERVKDYAILNGLKTYKVFEDALNFYLDAQEKENGESK